MVGQSQTEPRRWHGPQKHQERTQTILKFGAVFPIRLILIRIRIQLWIRPKIEKTTFFSIKNIYFPKNYLFCYLWDNYSCVITKVQFHFFFKYDVLVILIDFCMNFSWFWLIFGRNETTDPKGPDPPGSWKPGNLSCCLDLQNLMSVYNKSDP